MLRVREKQKEEEVQALKQSMQSGMVSVGFCHPFGLKTNPSSLQISTACHAFLI